MKENDFCALVRAHMAKYKRDVIGISENGTWKNKEHPHILPEEHGAKNIMLDASLFEINGDMLTLKPYGKKIKLHQGWRHLNSSQILCVNYFYPIISDNEKLNGLSAFLGAKEKAVSADFEFIVEDKSNIDLAIRLENGKYIYLEIKYCESEFGSASSKRAQNDGTYKRIRKTYHDSVLITDEDYLKHYQIIRNICLSHVSTGNITVFLIPSKNESINNQYEQSMKAIENPEDFNFKRIYWEDLISAFANSEIRKKYFNM